MNAFKWNVADQFLSQALGFAFNIIMVRLLLPADFGLFAVPMVILSCLTLQDGATTNINKGTNTLYAFVEKHLWIHYHIDHHHWRLNVHLGCSYCSLVDKPSEADIITKYLSIGFLFSIPMIFHETIFKKRLDFKSLFVTSIHHNFIWNYRCNIGI